MKRKIIALLLAAAMLTALCSCDFKLSDNNDKTTAADTTATAPEDTTAPKVTPIKDVTADSLKVGDYISLGSYEQDNNFSNGKESLEWLVIGIDGTRALVISRYGIDAKPYHYIESVSDNSETTAQDTAADRDSVTWESSTLRSWLNNDFASTAFTPEELKMIATVELTPDEPLLYGVNESNVTSDRIFLLSRSEAQDYFDLANDRSCMPTDYAAAMGAKLGEGNKNCYWWLRSAGNEQDMASGVGSDGYIIAEGFRVKNHSVAVRPAFWIELEG